LNEFKVTAQPSGGGEIKPVVLHKPVATFSQDGFGIAMTIDNNPATGWAVSPQFGKNQIAVFELKERITNENGTQFVFVLDQQYAGKEHNIGKFRLSVTGDEVPRLGEELPENLAVMLNTPEAQRTPDQKARLQQMHRALDARYNQLSLRVGIVPPKDKRVMGAQDLTWALINTPGFLFNR
jgi:hypothetical protein